MHLKMQIWTRYVAWEVLLSTPMQGLLWMPSIQVTGSDCMLLQPALLTAGDGCSPREDVQDHGRGWRAVCLLGPAQQVQSTLLATQNGRC